MQDSISQIAALVEEYLKHEGSGHDWQHIYRVWQTAQKLADAEEGADGELVSLAALLHDVDDYKLTGDAASEATLPNARAIMAKAKLPPRVVEEVCATLKTIGYSKSLQAGNTRSLEAHIVSDADQLEAMGAIGIARSFAYCARKGLGIFSPERLPRENMSAETYRTDQAPSVNHHFEKSLKLRHLTHTKAGRAEAQIRHARMVSFLEGFFEETAAPQAWKDLLNSYR